MVVEIVFFIFSTCVTTLSLYVPMVDNTVDGKDNYMEETMEIGDSTTYHPSLDVL